MAEFDNHDGEPIVHKIINCDTTSLKPDRPIIPHSSTGASYVHNVSAGKRSVVDHVKRRLSCVWRVSTAWIIQNQIDLAFSLLALLVLAHHLIPDAQPHTVKFFTLSYYNRFSGKYSNGKDDAFLI